MYSTSIYIYQQITQIVALDSSGQYFDRRYGPVYAKKLTVNKGVDNVLLFQIINQDQKPVNVTGSEFKFRIINTEGDRLLYESPMTVLSASLGRIRVTISANDTRQLPSDPCGFSIERTSGILVESLYIDENSQGRGDIDVVDTVLPEFIPSRTVTIPDIYGPQLYPNPVSNQGLPDWARDQPPSFQNINPINYSSHVPTNGSSLTTFRLKFDNFTGNINAQGAENYQSEWYDVGPLYEFTNQSDPVFINVEGYHPLLRLAVNQYGGNIYSQQATANAVIENGVITSINVTNGGSGYVAAPNVTIVGTGAGAVAESVLSNGSVSSITVINGGNGYVPTPTSTQGAYVNINTGFITEIIVR
jgi:hypothetical protein